ncbi:hypothetical protein ACQFYA_18405 [Promicromonospora sp. Marseille-Q5078]
MSAQTRLQRFWCSRDGSYSLDDDGFLRDPNAAMLHTESAGTGIEATEQLGDYRCLVLLGEPGAGKSTAIADTTFLAAGGVSVLAFDLSSYGSEDRLVREVFEAPSLADWSSGSGQLCLVLDALDEARARIPHIGSIIASRLRQLPCDRLFVRIACRTADWPASLERICCTNR